MSIRRRNGRYQVVLSEWVGGVRHQRITPAGTDLAAARALEARLKAEQTLRPPLAITGLTVAEYARGWLRRVDVRRRTLAGYRQQVEGAIIPVLGDIPLHRLTTADVERFRAAIANRSPRTQHHLHTRLNQLCRDAVRRGALQRNPCDAVPPPRVPQRELSALSGNTAAHLMAALPDDARGLLIGLALLTGMRRSELLGLQWADIDLAAGALTVQRSVHHLPGRGVVVEPPKRTSSRRRLALPVEAVALLRRHQHAAGPWVFGGAAPVNPDLLGATANRWLKKHHDITLHGLRHTQATLLIAAGVSVKVVSERLGHASTAITLDLYTHTAPEQDRAAADTVSGLLGGKSSPSVTPGVTPEPESVAKQAG